MDSPWIRAGTTKGRYPLAEYLGVSPRTAHKIRKALDEKAHRVDAKSKIVLFLKEDVDEFIKSGGLAKIDETEKKGD